MVSQLKKGVLLSYIHIAVTVLINLFYTPFLLFYLGKNEYGIYTLSTSVVNYFSILNAGFASAYIRYYYVTIKENDKFKIYSLNGLFLIVFLTIALGILVFGIIFLLNIEDVFNFELSNSELNLAKVLMFVMLINLVINTPFGLLTAFLLTHEKFVIQRSLSILQVVLPPVLSVPFLINGCKSFTIVFIISLVTFSNFVFNFYYCVKFLKIKFSFKNIDIHLFKEVSLFSFFIVLQSIMDKCNWEVNKFILSIYSGSEHVAIYSLANSINFLFMSLIASLASVFIPKVNKLIILQDNQNEVNELFIKISRLQFYILMFLFCGYVFLGRTFINIWIGEGFENVYYCSLLLMCAVIVPLTQTLGLEILRAKNKHSFANIIYVVSAGAGCYLSTVLVQKYDELGVSLATFISMFIAHTIIASIIYKYMAKIDILNYFNNINNLIVKTTPIFLIIFLLRQNVQNTLESFLVYAFMYSIIYFCYNYKFVFNNYEKGIAQKIYGVVKNVI